MTRRIRLTAALSALAVLGVAAAALAVDQNPNTLKANMTGGKEVPGPGDSNGTGTALVTLKGGQGKICAHITFSRIAKPLAGHIHKGGPQVAGGIVVSLFESSSGLSSPINKCKSASGALIRDIREHPGRFYVNLHNGPFPGGAMRGQLRQR